jgi:vacuolar protein sorting-associated protein 45
MARKLGQELLVSSIDPVSSNRKKENSDGRLQYQFSAEPQLFSFRPSSVPPILLILDRRNDPVTPLLSQWTYQAMVHDLIGMTNGRVSLANAPDVRDEHREIVLSTEQDPFFSRTLYDNLGDLGAHIKEYVAEYQVKGGKQSKIETVKDMKRFVEEYPEFRKLGGNVSKHVALLGELSRLVDKERLLEVSELEQSLASTESHASDLRVRTGIACSTYKICNPIELTTLRCRAFSS